MYYGTRIIYKINTNYTLTAWLRGGNDAKRISV